MKKKMIITLSVILVIVGAIFAWRIAYSMHKNTDNIPALAMVSEMDDASFLVAYRSNQLIAVWGEPDEESPTTIGTTILTWEIDEETSLSVHIDSENKVASYELKNDIIHDESEAIAVKGDYVAAIMIEDVVYYLAYAMPAEIDESAIIGYTTSYTDEMPQSNGETNFNRELNMPYARVSDGIAILYENEWWLCKP